MRSMADYSLQVGSYGRDDSEITDHGTLFVVVCLVHMSFCVCAACLTTHCRWEATAGMTVNDDAVCSGWFGCNVTLLKV
jgi:hypothetical protein